MHSFWKTIGFNALIQITGKIFSAAIGFLNIVLLTRYLGSSGYGQFSLIISYLGIFSVFSDLGFQLTLVREIAKDKGNYDDTLGSYFFLKLVLVFVFLLLSFTVLPFLPYSVFLKTGILIGAAGIALGNLNSFFTAVLQSRLRLDLVTYIDIAGKVITTAFLLLFMFLSLGLYAIVNTVLVGNCAVLILYLLIFRGKLALLKIINLKKSGKLFLRAIPVGLILLLTSLYFKVDSFLLSLYRNITEVGYYSLSYKIIENILVLWGFYMATVYPLLARWTDTEKHLARNLIAKSILIGSTYSLACILVVQLYSEPIISLFFGTEFSSSGLALKILILALPFLVIDNILYNYLIANGKTVISILTLLFALVLNVTLNLATIPQWGYVAAAINTVLTELFIVLVYGFNLRRTL